MLKDFFKGVNFGLGFIFVLGLLFGVVYAVGFHNANEIVSGVFSGNYEFNGTVNFTGTTNGIGNSGSLILIYNNTFGFSNQDLSSDYELVELELDRFTNYKFYFSGYVSDNQSPWNSVNLAIRYNDISTGYVNTLTPADFCSTCGVLLAQPYTTASSAYLLGNADFVFGSGSNPVLFSKGASIISYNGASVDEWSNVGSFDNEGLIGNKVNVSFYFDNNGVSEGFGIQGFNLIVYKLN